MIQALRGMRRGGALIATVALSGCVSVGKTLPFARNPFTATEGPTPRLALYTIDWWHALVPPLSYEYAPREFATPAVDPEHDRVLTVTRDGQINAFNTKGAPVWNFQTHGRFEAGPLLQGGIAYVPAGDGNLYALDEETGAVKWTYAAGEALATVPVLTDGKIVVASAADTVFVIDASSGKWLWQYRRDTPEGFTIHGTARPAVRDGVVFAGFSDGHLVALDLETGDVKWDHALSNATQFADVDTEPVFDESGTLLAASYSDGLYALDPQTGDTRWRAKESAGISNLLLRGEVVFGSGEHGVSAFTTAHGAQLWHLDLGNRAAQQPVFVKGTMLVPTVDSLAFVNPTTGKIQLTFDPGNGVTAAPATLGDKAFVLSNNGYIYAMEVHG